mgnify:CR=1 FL=1|jgi:hypothetical protein|nr:MAG TPA: protein of unknown function (DUF5405) [Caudoviricetes sp.]
MRINKEYEILVDSIGTYILRQHYISKVGTPTFKDIGYYRTLEQARKGILKQGIAKSELKDVDTVIEYINRAIDLIRDIPVKGVK